MNILIDFAHKAVQLTRRKLVYINCEINVSKW